MAEKDKHGGRRPGAGRPRSGRDDVAVKIDRGIVAQARFVSDARGLSLAEFLSNLLRGPVSREFTKEAQRLKADEGPANE